MNLAMLLAGVDGADGVSAAAIEAILSEAGVFEHHDPLPSVREYSLARRRGDAAELAALLRPLWVDEWRERRAPAILRIKAGRQDMWSDQTHELDAFEGREIRSGRHFEAWYGEEATIISPQDGGSREPTIDLLVPLDAGESVALVPVSSPVGAGEWDAVAEDLQARARRLPALDRSRPDFKCKAALVRGSDQLWRVGCDPGACETECAIKIVPGERGVDSFRCDCTLPESIVRPVDVVEPEIVRESSA